MPTNKTKQDPYVSLNEADVTSDYIRNKYNLDEYRQEKKVGSWQNKLSFRENQELKNDQKTALKKYLDNPDNQVKIREFCFGEIQVHVKNTKKKLESDTQVINRLKTQEKKKVREEQRKEQKRVEEEKRKEMSKICNEQIITLD